MKNAKSSSYPVKPTQGKLGVLLPGMGAVSSTFIAGVYLCRKGLGKPIGSLTQMQTIRLGKRYENRAPLIKDFVPLAGLGAENEQEPPPAAGPAHDPLRQPPLPGTGGAGVRGQHRNRGRDLLETGR